MFVPHCTIASSRLSAVASNSVMAFSLAQSGMCAMCWTFPHEKPTLDTTSKPSSWNIRVAEPLPIVSHGVRRPIRFAP